MFWGVTPALDFQEQLSKTNLDLNSDHLHVLIVGSCDVRHVLKTMAQSYRHKQKKLTFYIAEGCPDLIARDLLLIAMALEKTKYCGLLEKTRRFMEVYGNTLVRTTTSRYINAKGKQLMNLVTDANLMETCLPVNISDVRFKERDYMETLYSFWKIGSTNTFDICKLWDRRLRQELASRYDTRAGVFDWDFHMRLKEVTKRVSSQEYKHFREHGVAFTWLETEVCRPNMTLAAGVFKAGDKYFHSGYLGDMTVSPYIAFGLDCEDEDMLKGSNGLNHKRATDVTERNIMRMFYEIENKTKFCPEDFAGDTNHNLGMVVISNIDAKISDAEQLEKSIILPEEQDLHLMTDSIDIKLLSFSNVEHMAKKSEFEKYFDMVYVGQNVLNRFEPGMFNMTKSGGLVVFESRKYFVYLKRDTIKSFGSSITDVATAANLELIGDFDPLQDDYAFYAAKN